MNSKTIKTSASAVLGLALGIASLTASATHSPARQTIELGTIQVTPADTETARAVRQHATVELGVIRVTPADASDARYAAAERRGTVNLGTVKVTPRDAKPALLGEVLAATHRLAQKTVYAMVTALVFARTWG